MEVAGKEVRKEEVRMGLRERTEVLRCCWYSRSSAITGRLRCRYKEGRGMLVWCGLDIAYTAFGQNNLCYGKHEVILP